jgi:Histidine phosphatase superfamily (branch 1)
MSKDDRSIPNDLSRRKVLDSVSLMTTPMMIPFPTITYAMTTSDMIRSETTTMINCLSDLPILDQRNCFRLFLCRHGETENNRLKLVQGARIDAPINENGAKQAMLLGQALLYAPEPPELFFHSPMKRAMETAKIASNQYPISLQPKVYELNSLKELDFGAAIEQTSVDVMRAQRVQTYTAWAMGKLDARMAEDGESGKEVSLLYRYSYHPLFTSQK